MAQRKEREFWSRTDYDRQLQRVTERYAPLLIELRDVLPERASTIDVGCGPTCAARFLKAEHRVFLDPLMDSYRRRFAAELPVGELVRAWAEAIPAADGAFDAAVCVNALDHMIDPEIGLAEIHRVLKPGGLLFLGLFVHPATLAVARRAIDRWLPSFREDAHPFHFCRRSARDMVMRRFDLKTEILVHAPRDAWFPSVHRQDRVYLARKTAPCPATAPWPVALGAGAETAAGRARSVLPASRERDREILGGPVRGG